MTLPSLVKPRADNHKKIIFIQFHFRMFLRTAVRLEKSAAVLFIYTGKEPKSVLAQDLGDCRVNLKNTLCKFLIVLQEIVFLLNKKPYARKSAAIYKTDIVRTAADALTGKRTEK